MEKNLSPAAGQEQKIDPTGAKAGKHTALKKELVGLVCLLLALLVFIWFFQRVLIPKRLDYGATWDMYLKEPENTVDVLFFGTSIAYCDIAPGVIYDEAGVTSYVMAGPEQTIPVTYRYLLESCRSQSPKVIFVEATGLLYGQNNRSLKVNLTYMPWGKNRLAATFAEAEKSEWPGLLFPMYAYHDRWDDLTAQDFQIALSGYDRDPLAGYTFLSRIQPVEEIQVRDYADVEENYPRNLEAAGEIVAYCQAKGIRPVFFLAPSVNRVSDELTARMDADLTGMGADFINYNEVFDRFGFDLSRDFYDTLHTNCWGAEKLSRYLAGTLTDLGLVPTEGEDAALWQGRAEHFYTRTAEAAQSPDGEGGAAA